MLVTIKYTDSSSLTVEEIVKAAETNYGKYVDVEVQPDSSIAYDQIYFGLQQLLTFDQLSLYYDKTNNYNIEIVRLRNNLLEKVTEIVDQVILDNEERIGKEE